MAVLAVLALQINLLAIRAGIWLCQWIFRAIARWWRISGWSRR